MRKPHGERLLRTKMKERDEEKRTYGRLHPPPNIYFSAPAAAPTVESRVEESLPHSAPDVGPWSVTAECPSVLTPLREVWESKKIDPPAVWPTTICQHLIIEQTSNFVLKEGRQSEFRLRLADESRQAFPFIWADHPLHPYFVHLQRNPVRLWNVAPAYVPPRLLRAIRRRRRPPPPPTVPVAPDSLDKNSPRKPAVIPLDGKGTKEASTKLPQSKESVTAAAQSEPPTTAAKTPPPTPVAAPTGIGLLLSSYFDDPSECDVEPPVVPPPRPRKTRFSDAPSDPTSAIINPSASSAAVSAFRENSSKRTRFDDPLHDTESSGSAARELVPAVCWKPPTAELGIQENTSRVIQEVAYRLLRSNSDLLIRAASSISEEQSHWDFLRPATMAHRYWRYVLENVIQFRKERRRRSEEDKPIPLVTNYDFHPDTSAVMKAIVDCSKSLEDYRGRRRTTDPISTPPQASVSFQPATDNVNALSDTANLERTLRRQRVMAILQAKMSKG